MDPVGVPLISATDTSESASMVVSREEQDEVDAAAALAAGAVVDGIGEKALSHATLATDSTLGPLTTPPTGSTLEVNNDSPVGINSGVTVTNHPINKSAKQPPTPVLPEASTGSAIPTRRSNRLQQNNFSAPTPPVPRGGSVESFECAASDLKETLLLVQQPSRGTEI